MDEVDRLWFPNAWDRVDLADLELLGSIGSDSFLPAPQPQAVLTGQSKPSAHPAHRLLFCMSEP